MSMRMSRILAKVLACSASMAMIGFALDRGPEDRSFPEKASLHLEVEAYTPQAGFKGALDYEPFPDSMRPKPRWPEDFEGCTVQYTGKITSKDAFTLQGEITQVKKVVVEQKNLTLTVSLGNGAIKGEWKNPSSLDIHAHSLFCFDGKVMATILKGQSPRLESVIEHDGRYGTRILVRSFSKSDDLGRYNVRVETYIIWEKSPDEHVPSKDCKYFKDLKEVKEVKEVKSTDEGAIPYFHAWTETQIWKEGAFWWEEMERKDPKGNITVKAKKIKEEVKKE